jgi:pilus assembly protein TadC
VTARHRRPSPSPSPSPDDLALLLDLLAAALAVGAPLVSALDAVAAACPEAPVVDLGHIRDLVTTGRLDEATDVPGAPPALLRALRRSGHSGSRLAEQLRLVADDLRAEAAATALDRAHRVGIWAVLPLGLCCLPAFVALAVVPLAYGLLRGALG